MSPREHFGTAEIRDEAPPRTGFNWIGLASVAFGLSNFVLLYLVGAPVALIMGYHARRAIRASEGRQTGMWVAVLGIALGWVGLGVNLYTFLAYNLHW